MIRHQRYRSGRETPSLDGSRLAAGAVVVAVVAVVGPWVPVVAVGGVLAAAAAGERLLGVLL